jgi:heptosyltransferase-2
MPNWLGDTLLARPLLQALRAWRPGVAILAVGPRALLEPIEAEGSVDGIEDWPREGGGREETTRRVRAWRPGVAIVLPQSFSSAWLAFRSGAAVRIGFRGEARSALLTHALPRQARGELHLSLEFLALGRAAGVEPVPFAPLRLPEAAHGAAREVLERTGWRAGARYAVIGPCSAYGPAREWPAERFVAVARALAARGLGVLVCGTAAERAACGRIADGAGPGVRAIAGETGLTALGALCAGAAVAVCVDSGIAHLAAATGTPTLQIYGSASSAWTHALGPRVRVIHRAPVCSPCFLRSCRIGTICMRDVTIADVLDACRELAA